MLGASGGSSWPMSSHDPEATNFNSGETSLTPGNLRHLHPVWKQTGHLSGFVVASGRVYAAFPQGILVLQPRTGKRLMLVTLRSLHLTSALLAVNLAYSRGVLVVATHDAIIAIQAHSGRFLWSFPVSFTTGVLVQGTTVFTGSYCFNGCPTRALDLRTGKILWENATGGLLQAIVGGRVYEGLLWHGSCQNRVLSADSGALITILPSCTQPIGAGNHLYAEVFPGDAHRPNMLGGLSPAGRLTWSIPLGKADEHPLALGYGTIFAAAHGRRDALVAVSTRAKRVLWRRPVEGSSALLLASHMVFVVDKESRSVKVLTVASGRTIRTIRVPGSDKSNPLSGTVVADGAVYAWLFNGLVAMRP